MKGSFIHRMSMIVMVVLGSLAITGCGNSDSVNSGKSGGSGKAAQVSGMEAEARDVVIAEVEKHWAKTPEGWITAVNSGDPSGRPLRFIGQLRELTVKGVTSHDLKESDRMNGFEWGGEVAFKSSPYREAGDRGYMEASGMLSIKRQSGAWTQWVETEPGSIRVEKFKGKWQVKNNSLFGTWLLRGKRPEADDFQNAGVK